MKKICLGFFLVAAFLGFYSWKENFGAKSDAMKQEIHVETVTSDKKRVPALSHKETEQIKLLMDLLKLAESSSISCHMGEGKVLCTDEEQYRFLLALNERDKTLFLQETYGEYVDFEEERMYITGEKARGLLAMAGATRDMGEWEQMLKKGGRYFVEGERLFLSDQNRIGSEILSEYTDWEFSVTEGGGLLVKCKIILEPWYGRAYELEAKLHKNTRSIFGGYTADYFMINFVDPNAPNEHFLSDFQAKDYETPLNLGSSFEDYIFELEGSRYKMPVPLKEMLRSGWKIQEALPKEQNRKEICLEKEGKRIFCVVWKDKKKDWYITALKTQAEGNEV